MSDLPLFVAGDDPRPRLATMLGADYSARALTPQRSDTAPGVVRAALGRFAPYDARRGLDLAAWHVADIGDAGAIRAADWERAFAAIDAHARRAFAAGAFVVGLGGDHSVSWPLVQAAAAACGRRIGVVQLDVHHDVRALDPGGPSNGTPFRGLLESGTIDAVDLVQVGIHPFGNRRELAEYCEAAGIRRISLDEVARLGPEGAASAALDALAHVDAIYCSVDIDVLDRAFAPGTAAALPGGLAPAVLLAIVEAICADPRTLALDVVEFDPDRDVGSVTAYAAANVVMAALSAVARRN